MKKVFIGLLTITSISAFADSSSFDRITNSLGDTQMKEVIKKHAPNLGPGDKTWTNFTGIKESYKDIPYQEMQGRIGYKLFFSIYSNELSNYGKEIKKCELTVVHHDYTDGKIEIVKAFSCTKL